MYMIQPNPVFSNRSSDPELERLREAVREAEIRQEKEYLRRRLRELGHPDPTRFPWSPLVPQWPPGTPPWTPPRRSPHKPVEKGDRSGARVVPVPGLDEVVRQVRKD